MDWNFAVVNSLDAAKRKSFIINLLKSLVFSSLLGLLFLYNTQCASFQHTNNSKASGLSGLAALLNIKQTVCAKIFRPTFAHKCHKSLALMA